VVNLFLDEDGFKPVGKYRSRTFVFFVEVDRMGCLEGVEDWAERIVSDLDLEVVVVREKTVRVNEPVKPMN